MNTRSIISASKVAPSSVARSNILRLPQAQLRHVATSQSTASSPASSSPSPRRRAVTVTNDTGAVPWRDLSFGEKAARSTQQTFNTALILLGLGATIGVAAVLYLEVFSTDSKTAVFNRSADRIRADPACRALLTGNDDMLHTSKRDIEAHGEPSWSRWARNRTIASKVEKDKMGIEHMHMHFYVSGPAAQGTVKVHMTRKPGERDFEYRLLALDVPGKSRQFVISDDAKADQRWQGKMFGVKWN